MNQIEKNTVSAENQTNSNVLIENEKGKGKRILFVGNSITRHGVKEDIGWLVDWGMAASAKEKDYVHRVMANVLEKDPDAAFCICQAYEWEREYKDGESMHSLYASAKSFKADIIIMRVIENCPIEESDKSIFKEKYLKFIQYLNPEGKAKVILTSSFWKKIGDDIIQEIAVENKLDFIYLGDLGECSDMRADGLFEHPGVAHHPGDMGMQKIAERIFEKVKLYL
jgi:hypothetical protein